MKFNLKEVWTILEKKERNKIFFVTFSQAISGLIDMLGVISILPFLSLLTDPEIINTNKYLLQINSYFNFDYKQLLVFLGLSSIFIIFINQLIRITSNWYASYVSHSIWLNLTGRMFYFFLSRNYSYYLKNNTYSLLEKISNQVNAAQAGVIEPTYKLINHFFSLFFILSSLIYLEPYITLITIFTLFFFYFLFFKLIKVKLENLGQTEPDTFKKLYNLYGDAFGAIKEIKISHNENYYKKIFLPLGKKHIKAQVTKRLIMDFPNGLAELIAFGGIIGLTLFLIFTANNFSSTVTTLALLGFALKRIIPSFNGIYHQIGTIKFFQASFEAIKSELLSANNENKDKQSNHFNETKMSFKQTIKIENVSFKHEGLKKNSIDEVSLKINKGEFIGITGLTGSGKSTLIDLILGLASPDKGSVLIDSVELNSSNSILWHNIIGYVDQTGFLTDNTILKNIAFGIDESKIDYEQVYKSANIAKISEFIENELPNKYKTHIGERGIRLSGGQRQRVRIARAIYKRPQILILDESTNALDSKTEEYVLNSLKKDFSDLTVIMITHRISTLKKCDKIFYLDEGKISLDLTYDQLIKKNIKDSNFNI